MSSDPRPQSAASANRASVPDAPAPTWPRLVHQLVRAEDLSAADAAWAMHEVMDGQASALHLASFLVALAAKGVSPQELAGLADAMVEHAVPLEAPAGAVDIVGTGGDLAQTVNISTMSSIVIAAAGHPVVKHGNRASTSRSGSADVLEALGIRLDLPPQTVQEMVHRTGITFCFAQVFHPSMRYAVEARKGVGIPTVFNVLGPITNPGRPAASAVGVADPTMAPTVAQVFAGRGTSALVFRGQDGLDELTVAAPSDVWEVRDGEVAHHELDPEALLGVPRSPIDALRGGTAEDNAQVARDLFDGAHGPVRDAVALNAAAGIHAARAASADRSDGAAFEERFAAAHAEAVRVLDSGAPREVLERWSRASQDA
ncbi:anthranilate phosphoribosyltransferase [Brachybacterium nesterenkovii]|uniref:Anthranilate phosphoribosyltransferase n=1 Tax=Brachybacterium nesterenkovii TaxID=47847 RepID=A0A1X6WVB2_9MICO|nr:anthranilate phosphoribosyltransferase [Brachybacterium nesterenkovii]SLM89385.1 Anthranilate phosphoribosyltransferase [Brachybacterium nesterenkovii]